MKMSNAEKLITMMLCEVMKKVKAIDELDPEVIEEAIHSDNLWAIEWKYPGLFADSTEDDPPAVSFVVDVLDMWSFIEDGYESLSKDEKIKIDEAVPFGIKKFPGFDGNKETRFLSIAHFLVGKLERFEEFKGRINNSHMPTEARYRQMLAAFDPIRVELGAPRPLTADEIISIFQR